MRCQKLSPSWILCSALAFGARDVLGGDDGAAHDQFADFARRQLFRILDVADRVVADSNHTPLDAAHAMSDTGPVAQGSLRRRFLQHFTARDGGDRQGFGGAVRCVDFAFPDGSPGACGDHVGRTGAPADRTRRRVDILICCPSQYRPTTFHKAGSERLGDAPVLYGFDDMRGSTWAGRVGSMTGITVDTPMAQLKSANSGKPRQIQPRGRNLVAALNLACLGREIPWL